ncbi:hypothetical protein BX589_12036 [Paraburkholderia fungorum]|jgi:hypothetical protein|uniref:hypothetical protein n=1 Tax=Paraburkholderia fungorum TaxID=134537 RepID=UPI000D07BBB7|nr:hypothetical protein [Paraburkholderia fungorum]PRZ51195.1 hypothetical protein BX589_12036 [Paraburkholderia fungorum]
MKRKIALLALLPLAACVSNQLHSGWERLRGQPIDVAIDKLGVPNSERTIAGHHVYTWSTSQTVATFEPENSFTTGTVTSGSGTAHYSGVTTGGTFVPTKFSCKIDIEVDSKEVMERMSYEGSLGGCSRYTRAMNQ